MDDPVAIAEGVGVGLFLFGVEFVVGIAGDVEPEAAPALTVAGRGEQSVDDFGEGVRGTIVEEGVDFVGGGRKTGEVVGGAADEGAFVGGGRGLESFGG